MYMYMCVKSRGCFEFTGNGILNTYDRVAEWKQKYLLWMMMTIARTTIFIV